MSDQGNKCK